MNDSTQHNMHQKTVHHRHHKHGPMMKITLGIIALVAIAIIATLLLIHSTPSKIVIIQLETLKNGDIAKAYDMNSKAFKEATSFDVFTSYVNSNPIFNDFKSVTFSINSLEKNSAYLKGVIEGTDKGQMDAEYKLVKENGNWKIEAIRLTPIGIKTQEATMETTHDDATTQTTPVIHGIMTSDVADADGYVEETKNVLPRSAKKIFVTAMLVSPTPDINVSATLKHIPTGVELGPIESKTTKTGNIMKAFSFTRENQLWPVGEYEVVIKLSSGDSQTIQFEVQ